MLRNILVTGGAGYVGSALVPKLLNKGYNVVVLDLLIYGEKVLKPHKNLRLIKGDIRNRSLLEKVLVNIDAVIHFAGLKAVGESVKKPLLYYQTNLVSTLNLLNVIILGSLTT